MPAPKPHISRHRRASVGLVALAAALTPGAALLGAGTGVASGAAGPARAAGALTLSEHSTLHITVNRGSSVEAEGRAYGTLNGVLSLRVVVNSAERLSAYLVGRSSAGTLSGKGTASFGVSGSSLLYKGAVGVTHGTGRYSHASGSGIRISGVMDRHRQTITLVVSGHINL